MSDSVGKKTLKFSDVMDLILSKEIRGKKLDLILEPVLNIANRGKSASIHLINCGKSKSKGKNKAC